MLIAAVFVIAFSLGVIAGRLLHSPYAAQDREIERTYSNGGE